MQQPLSTPGALALGAALVVAVSACDSGRSGGLDFVVPGLGGLNLDARLVRGLARLGSDGQGGDIKNQAMTLMLGYYLGR